MDKQSMHENTKRVRAFRAIFDSARNPNFKPVNQHFIINICDVALSMCALNTVQRACAARRGAAIVPISLRPRRFVQHALSVFFRYRLRREDI